jgi:hypothetical protein
MSGCQTCGGYGDKHDLAAHGLSLVADEYVEVDNDILDRWWLCSSTEMEDWPE